MKNTRLLSLTVLLWCAGLVNDLAGQEIKEGDTLLLVNTMNEAAYQYIIDEHIEVSPMPRTLYPPCFYGVVKRISDVVRMQVFERRNNAADRLHGLYSLQADETRDATLVFTGKQIHFGAETKVREVRYYNNQHLLVKAEEFDDIGNIIRQMKRDADNSYEYVENRNAANGENTLDTDTNLLFTRLYCLNDSDCVCVKGYQDRQDTVLRGSLKSVLDNENPLFLFVETMPGFPGGKGALAQYLSVHLVYPKECQEQGISGRTVLQLVVNPDGSVSDVAVAKSSGDKRLDEEAVRVTASMPCWIPGKQNGRYVRVRCHLPVNFFLR